jgi:hypothetical protein
VSVSWAIVQSAMGSRLVFVQELRRLSGASCVLILHPSLSDQTVNPGGGSLASVVNGIDFLARHLAPCSRRISAGAGGGQGSTVSIKPGAATVQTVGRCMSGANHQFPCMYSVRSMK